MRSYASFVNDFESFIKLCYCMCNNMCVHTHLHVYIYIYIHIHIGVWGAYANGTYSVRGLCESVWCVCAEGGSGSLANLEAFLSY